MIDNVLQMLATIDLVWLAEITLVLKFLTALVGFVAAVTPLVRRTLRRARRTIARHRELRTARRTSDRA